MATLILLNFLIILVNFGNSEIFVPDSYKDASDILTLPKYSELFAEDMPERNVSKSDKTNGLVTGGQKADLGEFPHYLLMFIEVKDNSKFLCGGSLIKYNWALTAGHCVHTDFQKLELFAGIVDLDEPAAWHTVLQRSNVRLHPDYNDKTLQNDIALVNIIDAPEDLLKYPNVGTIDLPNEHSEDEFVGVNGVISGFGQYSDTTKSNSKILKYTSIPAMKNNDCGKSFKTGQIKDTNICARATPKASTCRGDSGGPYGFNIRGNDVLIGVVSFGRGVCERGYPVAFTRVVKYLDWIKATIK